MFQDKVLNTKIVFSDDEDTPRRHSYAAKPKVSLFDKEDSGDELDFSIKEQYEGKKGQKVRMTYKYQLLWTYYTHRYTIRYIGVFIYHFVPNLATNIFQ